MAGSWNVDLALAGVRKAVGFQNVGLSFGLDDQKVMFVRMDEVPGRTLRPITSTAQLQRTGCTWRCPALWRLARALKSALAPTHLLLTGVGVPWHVALIARDDDTFPAETAPAVAR